MSKIIKFFLNLFAAKVDFVRTKCYCCLYWRDFLEPTERLAYKEADDDYETLC